MPIIFCSANLVALVGKNRMMSNTGMPETDPGARWNARLFHLNGRKCIIWTNKATLYSIVRLNVRKNDCVDLTSLFLSSLFVQLQQDGFYNEVQDNYWLDNIQKFVFATTDNDKKVIGSMNDFTRQLKAGVTMGSTLLKEVNNLSVANYLNRIPMGLINYKYPLDSFRELLNKD